MRINRICNTKSLSDLFFNRFFLLQNNLLNLWVCVVNLHRFFYTFFIVENPVLNASIESFYLSDIQNIFLSIYLPIYLYLFIFLPRILD